MYQSPQFDTLEVVPNTKALFACHDVAQFIKKVSRLEIGPGANQNPTWLLLQNLSGI